ncbi:hypothetical protein [Plantactinospora sp. KLBMP9567]|uniref:Hsp70 family protein n=1 Tax=Plantactinospora sp. KLBMP9567 TaxID=3085900 RepID=UPI002981DC44|nr:hypothetical protein [Plantactinospora sp. KLBMP9567]MDW5330631.1 hypothetical protein [Plantactinospora sp. KLBMP9567]
MAEIRVVAVIDFGTHGCGFAWTFLSPLHDDPCQRQIFTCDEWPGQPSPYPKTLTALIIDRRGDVLSWGWEAHRMWRTHGLELYHTGHRYKKHFKLSLARFGDERPPRRGVSLNDCEDSPERLVVAFLKRVYQRALTEISGSGYRADEIRWCLTVPAIWDDYQKQLMREAAYEAGMPTEDGRLILALEPEAAAYHARVSGVSVNGAEDGRDLTQPGTRFMVVDCGGGTIDITAYRNDENGLMVEIGRAYGDKSGSAYLNKVFEETVLTKRLGGVEEMQRLANQCPAALEDLLDAWERVKVHATVDLAHPLYLPIGKALDRCLSESARYALPDLQGGDDEYIVVSPDEVRDIFEEVVPRILDMIDRQVDEMREAAGPAQSPEVVLLVGGFAASPYLQQRVRGHLLRRAEVRVVPRSAMAVLAGAVHFAYDPQTRARRSKYTYGIDVVTSFEEGADLPAKRRVNSRGEVNCVDRFAVFVRAGETVRTGHETVQGCIPVEGDQTEVDVDFYATREPEPRYVDEVGCYRIGRLTVNLVKVMHLDLTQRSIRVAMQFGETEIKARVTLGGSDLQLDTVLDFVAP